MENTVVNELNTVLKGEHMAVESYDRFIHMVEDDRVKEEFQKILDDHKRHVKLLEKRIEELGGEPKEDLGFAGVMANAKLAMRTMGDKKTIDLVKQAYDGEGKGIAMVKEIVKGDLDDESAKLMQDILAKEHEHLFNINRIIEELEELN
ncbi:MAG TPA: ferritin-like domain-containing protein [Acetivibrio clariflavus]|nr:ferritin-like domain-containing protein [Acetivibrio clariflavus]